MRDNQLHHPSSFDTHRYDRILGRVVKAMDLSPIERSSRGFEPRRMHSIFFFQYFFLSFSFNIYQKEKIYMISSKIYMVGSTGT